jgi:16S rRNA processing protein RimM
MLKKYLEAGRIVSTHGLRGEVRVEPWCDSPDFLTRFGRLYLENGQTALEVTRARAAGNVVLIKFAGVDDLEAAEKLRRRVVYIFRGDAELPQGTLFEQDLIGLSVVDAQTDKVYGTLSEVLHTGANDVYCVKLPSGGQELIPATDEVVRSIDPDTGIMLVTPLKGLFEDEN